MNTMYKHKSYIKISPEQMDTYEQIRNICNFLMGERMNVLLDTLENQKGENDTLGLIKATKKANDFALQNLSNELGKFIRPPLYNDDMNSLFSIRTEIQEMILCEVNSNIDYNIFFHDMRSVCQSILDTLTEMTEYKYHKPLTIKGEQVQEGKKITNENPTQTAITKTWKKLATTVDSFKIHDIISRISQGSKSESVQKQISDLMSSILIQNKKKISINPIDTKTIKNIESVILNEEKNQNGKFTDLSLNLRNDLHKTFADAANDKEYYRTLADILADSSADDIIDMKVLGYETFQITGHRQHAKNPEYYHLDIISRKETDTVSKKYTITCKAHEMRSAIKSRITYKNAHGIDMITGLDIMYMRNIGPKIQKESTNSIKTQPVSFWQKLKKTVGMK